MIEPSLRPGLRIRDNQALASAYGKSPRIELWQNLALGRLPRNQSSVGRVRRCGKPGRPVHHPLRWGEVSIPL